MTLLLYNTHRLASRDEDDDRINSKHFVANKMVHFMGHHLTEKPAGSLLSTPVVLAGQLI